MSAALDGLFRALEPLRLYSLRTGSLVDRELAAYDAAFSTLEELSAEVLKQAFVQTADGDALARYESLVGLPPRDKLDDETRRALVLYRLGSAPLDFHREGMINSIRAAGMEPELDEHPESESLTVRCVTIVDSSLEQDGLTARVRTVLPAHLESEIDYGGLTWDRFDGKEINWDDWDAADFTWTIFDLEGDRIF